MLHGEQRDAFDLSFCVPSECADRLEQGSADIGIVPAVELSRLNLEVIPGAGIASYGPVRSILLFSKRPLRDVRSLAVDSSSRTSIVLAQVLLAELYGSLPRLLSMAPRLDSMIEAADAALIIGDPALHLDRSSLPYQSWDLGEEWTRMTGAPMVFAVWAGRGDCRQFEAEFRGSCRYGLEHLDEIIRIEAGRGISASLLSVLI